MLKRDKMPIGTQQEILVNTGFGIYKETKIQFHEYNNFEIVSDDIIRIYKTLVEYCHSEAKSSFGGSENLLQQVFCFGVGSTIVLFNP